MIKRKKYEWRCGDRTIQLGARTLVMGILNVTPDSFSDGGAYAAPAAAIDRALRMVEEGADIIDVGGESTRPGARPVSVEEEMRRTIPVIAGIRSQSDILLSIDTMKARTARAAIRAGIDIINDVSALEADPDMCSVAVETKAGVVLMHKKGSPESMQDHPVYEDVCSEVVSFLAERLDWCEAAGIARERIVVDPGIGFGKTLQHNLDLLRALPRFEQCARPVLLGVSRKSFIGKLLEQGTPAMRLHGSLGAAAWAVLNGAHILRVHDVLETCGVCRLVDTLRGSDADQ